VLVHCHANGDGRTYKQMSQVHNFVTEALVLGKQLPSCIAFDESFDKYEYCEVYFTIQ
jgi:hypothetical protein